MFRIRIFRRRNACRILVLAAGAPWLAFSSPADAQERQYKIEAAFLYSFFNYITWPGYNSPQALESPIICVYGNDPILYYLDYVRRKMITERRLSARIVSDGDDAAGCHLLFMRHRISYRMTQSLPESTLTVFKPDDPLDRGGMIELAEDNEHITIKINEVQIERQGFHISSRLLELARRTR